MPPRKPADLGAVQLANLAAVVASYQRGDSPERREVRAATKDLMTRLAAVAPGNSVEFRVPPFAAAQIVEGIRHRRGNPPATVECDPQTFIELAVGLLSWEHATEVGRLVASGERSDVSHLFPIVAMPLV